MRAFVAAAAALAISGGTALAQPGPARPAPRLRVTVIDSVSVVDVAARRIVAGQRIVIRGDSIVAVQSISAPLPDTFDERVSGQGAFAIPGLTDHHVHFSPGMTRALAQAARGGVAMVQGMAGPDFFVDPRFRSAGLGYAPGGAPSAQAVTANTNVALAVAAARGSGAEVLKLYAMMDSALVARLTTEAHRQGMRVVAHGTVFPARPLQLVQSGVDILTHVPYLS